MKRWFLCFMLALLLLISMVAFAVNIQPVRSEWTGTVYIRSDGSIDPPEAKTVMETFDNITYTLTGNIMSGGDGIVVERNNIIINGQGCMVEGTKTYDSRGIPLVKCNNITVKNVIVTKFDIGFYLFDCSNNNISESILTDNGFGVYLGSARCNSIYGNVITSNCWGVWLDSSLNNTVIKNEVVKSDYHGIKLRDSSNNTLQENSIIENGWNGIDLNDSSNNYILRNNLVKNGWRSIELHNANYTSIWENNIIESGYVSLYNSNHNEILRNNLIKNVHGILLVSSSNNTILENNIIESSSSGIWLKNSPSNCLIGNIFVNCGLVIYSCDLFFRDSHISSNNTVRDNFVNSKPLVYLENISNFIVKDAGQVILINCSNILVENLNLSKASQGILLWETNNTIVANNIIMKNWICIDLYHSHNNTIIGNTISTNFGTQAINTELGIILENSQRNRIVKNNMTKCSYSILLNTSQNNFIFQNNIENPIDFRESSNNNVVGNNLVNSSISLYSNSSNNRIYHNNFIASNVGICNSENLWDNGYPSGGNYWSNYDGPDLYWGSSQNETGSDGIGDAEYEIFANNVDRYPLKAPFTAFDAGTWNGVAYNVEVVSNSTVSSFYFNPEEGAFLRFNVTGDDGTTGFCRVAIPKSLLWVEDGWTITIGDKPITSYLEFENENFTYLYFTYNHSTQTVTIQGTHVIPELPPSQILQLLIILSVFTVAFAKKNAEKSVNFQKQN